MAKNISYEDAAVGWSIFRDGRANVAHAQLNAALEDLGRPPVSPRMYEHYRKLFRFNYTEYISVNRLDVRSASDSVFDTADRARYSSAASAGAGTLVVPTGSGALVLEGRLVLLSEGYATLRVSQSEDSAYVTSAKKYNRGVLVLNDVGVERAVQVVDGVRSDDGLSTDLILEFRSLLETELAQPTDSPTSDWIFEFSLGPSPSLFRVVEAMRRTFDLYESTRVLTNTWVGYAELDDAIAVEPAPVARVRRVELSNPVELVIGASPFAIAAAYYILKNLPPWLAEVATTASSWHKLDYDKQDERRKEELHKLNVQSLQLDNVKKSIELADIVQSTDDAVLGLLPEVTSLSLEQAERLSALKDQAIEAATELSLLSQQSIELTPLTSREGEHGSL